MPSSPTPALERLIDSVKPIVTMERDSLVVIALGSTSGDTGPACLTLDEATAAGAIEIHAFPYPAGSTGAAIGIGGRLVALELYDGPMTAGKLWRRVIDGAALIRDKRVVHLEVHRVRA